MREGVAYFNITSKKKAGQLFCLKGHTDGISAMATTDMGVVATGSKDASVRVWDLKKRS